MIIWYRLKKLAYLLLFMLGFIWFIFYSNLGLRSLIVLTEKLVPGNLSVQTVQGTFGNFKLQKLFYKTNQFQISTDFLHLAWHLRPNLQPQIIIDGFNLTNTNLTLFKPNATNASKSGIFPSWLKYFVLRHVNVINLTISNSEKMVKIPGILINKNSDVSYLLFMHSSLGNVTGKLTLKLTPDLSWDINLHGTEINPGHFYPDWDGKINISLLSNGSWGLKDKQFQINLPHLDGTLKNLPLRGVAQIAYHNGNLEVKKSDFYFLKSHAEIEGEFNSHWNMNWQLTVPELSLLLPNSQGAISSSGKFSGLATNPQMHANILLENLLYDNISIEKITTEADSNLHTRSLILNLDAKKINYKNYIISNLNLHTTSHFINKELITDAELVLSDKNKLAASITLPLFSTKDFSQPILGTITADFKNLNELMIIPLIKSQAGTFNARGSIYGKLNHPTLNVRSELKNAVFSLKNIHAQFNDVNIKCDYITGHAINSTGDFKLGGGRAALHASIELHNPDLFAAVRVEGDNLQINDQQYKIKFSPQILASYQNQNFNLQGKLFIPSANIRAGDFTQVTTLPSEVVFVDKNKPIALSTPTNLIMNIAVELGNDIQLTYQNLNTSLRGKITIYKNTNTLPTANGILYLTSGQYKAFGRALNIKDGRLIYAGNLLTDPTLDIRASQKFEIVALNEIQNQFNAADSTQPIYQGSKEISAGVWVKGTLQSPKIILYSDPVGIDQNDILSYLLFGVPRSKISSADSLSLLNVAASLNPNGSGTSLDDVANKFKKTLKLNDLSIGKTEVYDPSKNTTENTTTFNIGRQLGKKLSVHYKVGLFTPISILNLKYKFNKRLALQTESSNLDNGADFLYEIEFD